MLVKLWNSKGEKKIKLSNGINRLTYPHGKKVRLASDCFYAALDIKKQWKISTGF